MPSFLNSDCPLREILSRSHCDVALGVHEEFVDIAVTNWLLALLTYPGIDSGSVRNRREFFAAWASTLFFEPSRADDLAGLAPQGADPLAFAQFAVEELKQHERAKAEFFLSSVGGMKTLANANSFEHYCSEFDKHAETRRRIGETMTLLRAASIHHNRELRGGASLSKALDFVFGADGINLPDAMKTWTAWRPVAHFCAAYTYLWNTRITWKDGGFPDGELGHFFQTALDFERWGLSFTSLRAKSALLSVDQLWSVDDGLAQLPNAITKFGPLPPKTLDTLIKRRVPPR